MLRWGAEWPVMEGQRNFSVYNERKEVLWMRKKYLAGFLLAITLGAAVVGCGK